MVVRGETWGWWLVGYYNVDDDNIPCTIPRAVLVLARGEVAGVEVK